MVLVMFCIGNVLYVCIIYLLKSLSILYLILMWLWHMYVQSRRKRHLLRVSVARRFRALQQASFEEKAIYLQSVCKSARAMDMLRSIMMFAETEEKADMHTLVREFHNEDGSSSLQKFRTSSRRSSHKVCDVPVHYMYRAISRHRRLMPGLMRR